MKDIEAFRLTQNRWDDTTAWPEWLRLALAMPYQTRNKLRRTADNELFLWILPTLEVKVEANDWICRDVNGHLYCFDANMLSQAGFRPVETHPKEPGFLARFYSWFLRK